MTLENCPSTNLPCSLRTIIYLERETLKADIDFYKSRFGKLMRFFCYSQAINIDSQFNIEERQSRLDCLNAILNINCNAESCISDGAYQNLNLEIK